MLLKPLAGGTQIIDRMMEFQTEVDESIKCLIFGYFQSCLFFLILSLCNEVCKIRIELGPSKIFHVNRFIRNLTLFSKGIIRYSYLFQRNNVN